MSKQTTPVNDGVASQKPRVGFWQHRWVQDGVPLVTSTAVHVGLFILGLIAVHAVMRPMVSGHVEPKFVPTMNLGEVNPGGLPGPAIPNPTKSAQEQDHVTDPGTSAFKTSQNDAGTEKLKPMLGDAVDIARGDLISAGTKNGSLDGLGTSGVGKEREFGPKGPGGGDGDKDGKYMFVGPPRNPTYSAIFVCDGSGSMVGGKDEKLRLELKKAVDRLAAVQSFNVLLFQQSGTKKFDSLAGQLLMAGSNNKSKLFKFVDDKMTFHGVTDPLPAIEEAFKEHPQLIYLLTDGAFENNDPDETQQADGAGVIARIAALNKDKKVHVNTILLMGSKKEVDQLKDAEDVMKKIARENGGEYKRAFADDFRKQYIAGVIAR